jgi:hypothetical protein
VLITPSRLTIALHCSSCMRRSLRNGAPVIYFKHQSSCGSQRSCAHARMHCCDWHSRLETSEPVPDHCLQHYMQHYTALCAALYSNIYCSVVCKVQDLVPLRLLSQWVPLDPAASGLNLFECRGSVLATGSDTGLSPSRITLLCEMPFKCIVTGLRYNGHVRINSELQPQLALVCNCVWSACDSAALILAET